MHTHGIEPVEQPLESGQRPLREHHARHGFEMRDLLGTRQPVQDRLAERGGIGADARAGAADHAMALHASLHAREMDDLPMFERAERGGLRDLRHDLAQQRRRMGGEIPGREGGEAEFQAAQRERQRRLPGTPRR